ncbi:MAG: tail fiber protein [Bacilli bacterium]|nr:tail fiber protein [Bacilli bacterium]
MKKGFKDKSFGFIIGIIFASFSIVFASSYLASEIGYTPADVAWTVDNVQSATDSLYHTVKKKNPVGEIIIYMGTIVPEFFLPCDGSIYNISDYPYLAEQIKNNFGSYNNFGGNGTTTFAVPDLRGEFLRGTGTNSHSSQGNGASVGTHQDATFLPGAIGAGSTTSAYIFAAGSWNVPSNFDYGINQTSEASISTSNKNTSRISGGTVRPTNTSVLYAIRYE